MLNHSGLLKFRKPCKTLVAWRLFNKFLFIIPFLFSEITFAGTNNGLVYHGRILAPDGSAINSGSASFTLQVYGRSTRFWDGSALQTGNTRCLLYQESHSKNMSGSLGAFELIIGEGTGAIWGAGATASDQRISKLFINNPLDTANYIKAVSCTVGSGLYFPSGPDATAPEWVDRELVVTIAVNGSSFTLSPVLIKAQPFAMQAQQVGGFSPQSLFRIDGTSNLKFSTFQHDFLAAAISRDGSSVMRLIGLPMVPMSATEATSKAYVDATVASAISGAGVVTSVGGTAPIQSSGGANPAISISQASATIPGYLAASDWVTFNNKLGTSTSFAGEVSGPYNNIVINAGVITTAKISDAAVTFAKMQNLTGPALVGRGAVGAGSAEEISVGSGLALSVGGVLSVTNAGNVTAVGGTAPIQSSGGATPTISISQASSTIPGFLAASDWVSFNNKLGAGSIFAGDVSGPYNANVINPGAVTYAKIQNVTTGFMLGRSTGGAGSAEEISVGSGLSLSGGVLSTSGAGLVNTVSGVGPISSSGGANPAISISQASSTIPGFLAASDWVTFNNKLGTASVFAGDVSGTYNSNFIIANAVTTAKISDANVTFAKIQNVTTGFMLGRSTAGPGSAEQISVGSGLSLSGGVLSTSGAGLVNTVSGVGPISSSGGANPAISISQASSTIPGFLAASDWVTFNNKVSSVSGAGLVSIGGTPLAPSVNISMGFQTLAGRFSAGSGIAQEISIGNGLSLSGGGVLTVAASGVVASVNGSAPIQSTGGSNPTLSISQASNTIPGFLSSADWVTFNNKIGSLTGAGPVSVALGAVPSISISQASNSVSGFLSSTDWVTFNNKLGTSTVLAGEVSGPLGATVIQPGVVTFAKLQNLSGPALIGRGGAGAGVAGEISVGSGLSLSVGGVLTTSGAGLVNSVTGTAPIQSSGGANPAISISQASSTIPGFLATADWTTFNNKLGTASVFAGDVSGTYNSNFIIANAVTTAKISDANVTFAKIQNVTTGFMLGRSTAGPGSAEQISVGSGLSLSGGVLTTSGAGLVNTVSGVGPISSSGGANPAISISQASSTIPGFLAASDWVTFNNKVSSVSGAGLVSIGGTPLAPSVNISMGFQTLAGRFSAGSGIAQEISIGNGLSLSGTGVLTMSGAGIVASVNGSAPIQSTGGSNPTLSISQASNTVSGFLSSTDWVTFNNKLGTASVFAGDVSGTFNSNFIIANAVTTAKISDAAVTTAKISDAQVTFAKIQSLSGPALVGRGGAGAGVATEISVGSGLSLSAGGVLTTSGAGLVNNVTGTAPIQSSGGANPAISISQASATIPGFLAASDWVTFNNKVSSVSGAGLISIGGTATAPSAQISLGFQKLAGRFSAGSGVAEEISIGSGLNLSAGGVLTMSAAGVIASVNGSGPVSVTAGSNPVISISQATNTVSGFLSAADWVTFNNKLGASAVLAGEVSGPLGATVIQPGVVTFAKLQNITGPALIGRGGAGAGVATEISVGSGLSLSVGGVLTTSGAGLVNNVTGTAPIQSSGGANPAISISQASSTIPGFLSSTDWVTFNNKVSANLIRGVGAISVDNSGATPAISISTATTSVNGLLTSTDWTTFNSKLGSLTGAGLISIGGTATAPSAQISMGFQKLAGRFSAGSGVAEEISIGSGLNLSAGGVLTMSAAGVIASVNGSGPVSVTAGSNPVISISMATNTVSGFLTNTDWVTFNNKLGASAVLAGEVSGPLGATVIQPGVVTFAKLQNITGPALIGRGGAGAGVATEISVGSGLSLSAGGVLTTSGAGLVNNVTGTAPIQSSGGANPAISISQASNTIPGYLSSADWVTFNNKVSSVSSAGLVSIGGTPLAPSVNISMGFQTLAGRFSAGSGIAQEISIGSGLSLSGSGVLTMSAAGVIASVNGSGPVSVTAGSNPVISISQATNTVSGFLTNTDWVTFNNKIGALTGSGPVSVAMGATPSISISMASTSVSGTLSSTDWNIFNNKLSAITGSGLVSVTGGNAVSISMASQTLAGRFNAGSGVAEQISIGSGLSLSGSGVLTAAGGGASGFVNGGNAFGVNASIGTTDNRPLSILANNSPAVSVSQNGNVGIGSSMSGSNDANYKLNVNGRVIVGNYAATTYDATPQFSVVGPNVSAAQPVTMNIFDSSSMATGVGGGIGLMGSDGGFDRMFAIIQGGKENSTGGNYDGFFRVMTRTNGQGNLAERMRVTSAGNLGVGVTNPSYPLDVRGTIQSQGAAVGGALRLAEAAGTGNNFIAFKAADSLSADTTFLWPPNGGSLNQVLTTDGAGNLSWANPAAGGVTAVTGAGPISSTGGPTPAISISQATNTVSGFLTNSDWVTFNNKVSSVSGAGLISIGGTATAPSAQISLGFQKLAGRFSAGSGVAEEISIGSGLNLSAGGVLTMSAAGVIASVNGSGPVSVTAGSNPVISISQATNTVSGFLSAADWVTFNNKVSSITTSGMISLAGTATAPALSISLGQGFLLGRVNTGGSGPTSGISIGSGLAMSGAGVLSSTLVDTDTGITQLTGDVTAGAGNGSQVATIANNAVTSAKIADGTIVGGDISGSAALSIGSLATSGNVNVTGNLSASGIITGNGSGLTNVAASSVAWTNVTGRPTAVSAFTNDSGYLTSVATGNIVDGTIATIDVANSAVTYAKIQNVSAGSRLLGRDSTGAGVLQELTIGTGLSISAGGVLSSTVVDTNTGITQLTGDVTAGAGNGSQVATIANNAVTSAKIADGTIVGGDISGSAALSIGSLATSGNVNVTGNLSASGIITGNGSGLTNVAASSVAWTGVSGRPTAVSAFTNDSGYLTSASSLAWANISSKPFNWSGQGGQPSWLWGSNDGTNYYIWNPSNFNVNYATTAGGVAWTGVSGRPTAVSAFTNDSGYLTSASSLPWTSISGRPTAVSQFTNDSGYYAAGSSPSFNAVTGTGGLTLGTTSSVITMRDSDEGGQRYLHANSGVIGFLGSGGGWINYTNDSGQIWTSGYGWLHGAFLGTGAGAVGSANIADGSVAAADTNFANQALLTSSAPSFSGVTITGDWYRINGSNGIYWNTHGGGWNMTDSTWIRAYGGKNVYTSGSVQADAGFTGAAFYYSSDERLKQNINNIENPMSIINQLRGVTFDWRKDGQHDVGFIAQEVEKVAPELVQTSKDEMNGVQNPKSVKYGNIVAIAIEGIKELDVQCKASKEQLQAMQENLERHERSIASLQSSDTLQNQELAKLKAENAELRGELNEIKQMLKSQKSGGESPSWFNDILKLLGLN